MSFIRFDLTSLTLPAANSELTLYGWNDYPNNSFEIFGLNDGHAFENWGESSITYNSVQTVGVITTGGVNAPVVTSLGVFTIDNPNVPNKAYMFTSQALTDFINADSDNLITLILQDTSSSSSTAGPTFQSKESTGNPTLPSQPAGTFQPTLSVTPVPVPAAVWLFGSAVIGLVSFRKKEKV